MKKKEEKGERLRYNEIMRLKDEGVTMCGYMREMYIRGKRITGYCSLNDRTCLLEIPFSQSVCLECYDKWLERRNG